MPTLIRITETCPAPKGQGLYRRGAVVEAPERHAETLAAKGHADVLKTKKDLYRLAQEIGIHGRSTMTKDELRAAVTKAAPRST